MTTTQEKISLYFQSVKSFNYTDIDSKRYIKLKTTKKWNEEEAKKFQNIILHMNPIGFGGPFDFKCENENDLFNVTWNCYNMSD